METVRWIITAAPEIFLLLAIAIGTILGCIRARGFSIGITAWCSASPCPTRSATSC
ncbi:hypothetical protein SAMN05216338_1001176 [Bradyrhizobium sp. Rc2d]|nr:hypothetical protein SAMN05216338_1001176 [Bradyrhizobium sp. Rc2d]